MKKLYFEYVNKFFSKNNCELISTEYFGIDSQLEYKCQCGNISLITFYNFRLGQRCKICGINKRAKTRAKSFEDVKEIFRMNGCELLEKVYTNNRQLLEYICNCGNTSFISFSNFKKGKRCKICKIKNNSNENHYNCNPDREKIKITKVLTKKYHSTLRNTLKLIGSSKNNKSLTLLGYTPQDLMDHIINHPNWNNVKNSKWHLDHIYPVKAFIDYKITDIKIINCLENLQPLKSSDNLKKHDTYSYKQFEKWLESKLQPK